MPDRRWSRVDIKTICLLPNAIGFQDALEKGADDAILVRDGVAIEGAHQNFWAVFGDTAVTHPKTNHILPGITRDIVLEEARAAGMSVEERPIQVEELAHADEAFFTGTTGEVRPVVEIDGQPVGRRHGGRRDATPFRSLPRARRGGQGGRADGRDVPTRVSDRHTVARAPVRPLHRRTRAWAALSLVVLPTPAQRRTGCEAEAAAHAWSSSPPGARSPGRSPREGS